MTDTEALMMRRLALIHLIVRQLEDTGKIKIQKIMYFLQEALGVPLQYRFRMHHYGPFSEEIEDHTSVLHGLGYLNISPDPDGYGYHVKTESSNAIAFDDALKKDIDAITKAIDILGRLDAWELELFATVHFVQNLLGETSRREVILTVSRLKPKFSLETIEQAYNQLLEAGLIQEKTGQQ